MDKRDHLFTIQQLSHKLNIPKPTLRYWEKEFSGILVPLRTRGGQRRYTRRHITVIEEINSLRKRGKSLNEIRSRLTETPVWGSGSQEPWSIDFLADRIAEIVRSEITSFLGKNHFK
jgi:UDP-N-acetylglucosamine 4,6-dehydratase